MVDFTLTDEQQDLREMAHNFAEKEIRSVAAEFDREGTWPQEVIEKAWEILLPKKPGSFSGRNHFTTSRSKNARRREGASRKSLRAESD